VAPSPQSGGSGQLRKRRGVARPGEEKPLNWKALFAVGGLSLAILFWAAPSDHSTPGHNAKTDRLPVCEPMVLLTSCIPPAPATPLGKVATFSFWDPVIKPEVLDTTRPPQSFLFESVQLSIKVVSSIHEIPKQIKSEAIIKASTGPTFLDMASPTVFQGDIQVDVGALTDHQSLQTTIYTDALSINRITFAAGSNRLRGPPGSNLVKEIYVVGSIQIYNGPHQYGKSKQETRVVDMDLRPTDEDWSNHERDLMDWRSLVSDRTGIPIGDLRNVRTTSQMQNTVDGYDRTIRDTNGK
jgi:hypothetical protein